MCMIQTGTKKRLVSIIFFEGNCDQIRKRNRRVRIHDVGFSRTCGLPLNGNTTLCVYIDLEIISFHESASLSPCIHTRLPHAAGGPGRRATTFPASISKSVCHRLARRNLTSRFTARFIVTQSLVCRAPARCRQTLIQCQHHLPRALDKPPLPRTAPPPSSTTARSQFAAFERPPSTSGKRRTNLSLLKSSS